MFSSLVRNPVIILFLVGEYNLPKNKNKGYTYITTEGHKKHTKKSTINCRGLYETGLRTLFSSWSLYIYRHKDITRPV